MLSFIFVMKETKCHKGKLPVEPICLYFFKSQTKKNCMCEGGVNVSWRNSQLWNEDSVPRKTGKHFRWLRNICHHLMERKFPLAEVKP